MVLSILSIKALITEGLTEEQIGFSPTARGA
jgi:hypothetical protein